MSDDTRSTEKQESSDVSIPDERRRWPMHGFDLDASLPSGSKSDLVETALEKGEPVVDLFIGANFRTDVGREAVLLLTSRTDFNNFTRADGLRKAIGLLDGHTASHDQMQPEAFGQRLSTVMGEHGQRVVMSNVDQLRGYLGETEATADLREVIQGYVDGRLDDKDVLGHIGDAAFKLGFERELVVLSVAEARFCAEEKKAANSEAESAAGQGAEVKVDAEADTMREQTPELFYRASSSASEVIFRIRGQIKHLIPHITAELARQCANPLERYSDNDLLGAYKGTSFEQAAAGHLAEYKKKLAIVGDIIAGGTKLANGNMQAHDIEAADAWLDAAAEALDRLTRPALEANRTK